MNTGPEPVPELSLTRGGYLYRALRLAGIKKPAPAATAKAAILLVVITWVPLLALSLAQAPVSGGVSVPFLRDFSVAIRFLVTIPLFVVADSIVEPRLALVVRHLGAGDLVPAEERPRLVSAIERTVALRDASLPQLLILALALGLSLLGVTTTLSPEISSWHAVPTPSGFQPTWAGLVYDFLSLPLYRMVMLTWLWRYAIWIGFLWRASRLDLRARPSHPDLSGGLGFIGLGQMSFAILILAFSTSVASALGMRAIYAHAPLASFYPLIGGYLVLVLLVFLGPLFMFTPALFRTKKLGLHQYSSLGAEYVSAFEQKWIERRSAAGEPLLGSADIQSLADFANSFDVVRRMRAYPIDLMTLASLSAAAVAPLLPLALLEYPATELLGQIVRLLF